MRLPLARWLASLLLLGACDRVRALPGVQPRSSARPQSEPIEMGPWLLEPGERQMTVAWVTAAPSVGRVWYGTRDTDRLATEPAATTEHRVQVAGLEGGTQYRYRVEAAVEAGGVFTTAPAPGAPFNVLVYGDNRTNSGDHALLARAAAAEQTQVALHTGDMVANAADNDLWRVWFAEERDLLARTPLIPTMGNHEITDKGVAYSKYFQRRELPAYRSIDYGPLHIAVLDSFEIAAGATPHSAGISDAQRAWLEEDLRTVPEGRHVWVLVHQGPYAHPMHLRGAGHGGSEAVRQALAAGAKIHPIEAVFAGHEHFYERGEIEGTRYFVFGGGGAPLEEPDSSFAGVEMARKALSYAVVQVCGCHVTGQVKDIEGQVIDSFRLSDCDTPCGAVAQAAPAAGDAALRAVAAPAVVASPAAVAPSPSAASEGAPADAGTAGPLDAGAEEQESHRRRRPRRDRGAREGGPPAELPATAASADAGSP